MFNGNINHKLDYVVENGVNCLKKSFDNSNEQQLKLKREICFYQYCEKLDLKSVPKLISYDEKSIIIQFIEGNKLNYLGYKNLIYFTNFINDLNPINITNINSYKLRGGESVLSKNDLFENLKIRSMILSETRIYHPKNLAKIIDNHLSLFFLEKINVGKIIMSPSDFGLHNFILNNKGPYFIDFEYAGMDSVLKCILDFVLHPANNIELNNVELYIEKFINLLGLEDFRVSKYTINIFCIWWIMRLLNSISSKSIDSRINKGLILLHEKEGFVENRIKNIHKFYNYI